MVFTPGDKPYYCVEPVTHVSNAIHMAEPAAHGLRTVQPGETFDAFIEPFRLAVPRLLALLALGALQGAIGWWMVQSGIVDDVKVSHFRLAVHLMVALTTLAQIGTDQSDGLQSACHRGRGRRHQYLLADGQKV